MVRVGLSERDLLKWHDVTRKILGATGGARQNCGGTVAPLAPLAPPLPKGHDQASGWGHCMCSGTLAQFASEVRCENFISFGSKQATNARYLLQS